MKELHSSDVAVADTAPTQTKNALSAHEALAWLKVTFPLAFFDGRQCKPLKVGIIKDIIDYIETHPELSVSKTKVRLAVVQYTRQRYYITHLREGADRIDLTGTPAGQVNEEEAKSAQFKLRRKGKKPMMGNKRRPSMKTSISRRSATGTGGIVNPTIKIRHKRPLSYATGSSGNRDFSTKITLKKNPADLVPS